MTKQQKMIGWSLNIYVTSILMFYITQNVVANIMASYPGVADYAVKSLATLPTLFGLVTTFAMGPLAMRFSKVRLLVSVMCSMGASSLVFFANGVLHGPFEVFYLGCVLSGFGLGGFAPLMNTIISESFEKDGRASRIASYNVANNCGAFVILFLSGRIAAGNGGAMWPYAYLLGLYCFITTAAFVFLIHRAGYRDDRSARLERLARSREVGGDGAAVTTSGEEAFPIKPLLVVIGIGVLHLVFYIGINAYYTNVSTWIASEGLGGAVESANATSLVRFTLIVMTFLYPFWAKLLKNWMIPVGYALAAAGLAAMAGLSHSIAGVYACGFLVACSTSLAHSTVNATALNCVPARITAISSSLLWGLSNSGAFFSTYVLAGISGLVGGGMVAQLHAGTVILAACCVIAIAVFAVWNPDKRVAS